MQVETWNKTPFFPLLFLYLGHDESKYFVLRLETPITWFLAHWTKYRGPGWRWEYSLETEVEKEQIIHCNNFMKILYSPTLAEHVMTNPSKTVWNWKVPQNPD